MENLGISTVARADGRVTNEEQNDNESSQNSQLHSVDCNEDRNSDEMELEPVVSDDDDSEEMEEDQSPSHSNKANSDNLYHSNPMVRDLKVDSKKATKKRTRKKVGMRRNIRNVLSEQNLAEQTKKLREIEQERLKRLGLDGLHTSMVANEQTVRKPLNITSEKSKKPVEIPNVICLDTDSDEDVEKPPLKKNFNLERRQVDVVVLSSDSDECDDDISSEKKAQSDNYYSELGLHTNDLLNAKDENGRVLVNVNHIAADDDIFLDPSIGNILKPHQIGGVRFLYDNLIESTTNFRPDDGNGCILAHAMGLGKTVQTITFIDLYLRYTPSRKVLCVVPVNTIQNWMNEFNRWLPPRPQYQEPSSKMEQCCNTTSEPKLIKSLLDDMVDFVAYHLEKLRMPADESAAAAVHPEGILNKVESNDTVDTNIYISKPPQMMVNLPSEISCESSGEIDGHGDRGDCCTAQEMLPLKDSAEKNYRQFQVFLVDSLKSPIGRARIIEEWDKVGGVLLMGYEMYRSIAINSSNRKSKAKPKKVLKDESGDVFPRLKMAICQPGPDLVVCDEGHRIRNYQSGISQALKSIRTRKRLVLTGYPLQNNLIEYWCMVDFVRPNYLGSRQEFANMFERPIMNGQCVDSTKKDKHLMMQRAHVLYSLLEGFVQRRGHSVFKAILPDKEEHVLMIRLSPIQKALYRKLAELTKDAYNDSLNPIKTFCLCCKIWNHPDILYKAIKASLQGQRMDIISDDDDIPLDDTTNRTKRKKKTVSARSSPSIPHLTLTEVSQQNIQNVGFDPFGTEAREILTDISQWAGPIFRESPFTPGDIENSGKFYVLKQLIDECLECDDKMLIFSQSLLTLNCMEEMLQKTNVNSSPEMFWQKGRDYYRLDGSTGSMERERLINAFNDPENRQTKLFLLSTKAGCLGINLVAANRVVVFDVSWNPCHDAQAVCRIYRYGQTKRCYIYRLVSSNTMEKKIYYRQISKQGISDRVVDELNLTENFSKSEIQSLILNDFEEEPTLDFHDLSTLNSTDTILSSVLEKCGQWITKIPFKHESLLINESTGKLSGSEKRAAKRAYERERIHAQTSHVPYRTYPLQQNFPRNTPVAPVRPFLWRPPTHSSSWPNFQNLNSLTSSNQLPSYVEGMQRLRHLQTLSHPLLNFDSSANPTPTNFTRARAGGEQRISTSSTIVNELLAQARGQLAASAFVRRSVSGEREEQTSNNVFPHTISTSNQPQETPAVVATGDSYSISNTVTSSQPSGHSQSNISTLYFHNAMPALGPIHASLTHFQAPQTNSTSLHNFQSGDNIMNMHHLVGANETVNLHTHAFDNSASANSVPSDLSTRQKDNTVVNGPYCAGTDSPATLSFQDDSSNNDAYDSDQSDSLSFGDDIIVLDD